MADEPAVSVALDPADLEWTAIRAQGAGGQNVNKVASAVQVRFDIRRAALPEDVRQRLLERRDRRISADGVLVIKAQRHRTQERNLDDAFARVQAVVDAAATAPKARKPTRPSLGAKRARLETKVKRGEIKSARKRVHPDE